MKENQMRRLLTFTTLFAILFSGLSAPVANATGCLAQTGTVVTGIGTCTGAITIPDGVTGIGDQAFANTQITSITIPASVTSIGTYAFFNTFSLETVTFDAESELEIIGPKSFFNAAALTSITIPESVTSIGDTAFFNNGSLASIDVDPANEAYKDMSGVLFTNDGSELLTYPLGKTGTSYIIPASVAVIKNSAFGYNSRLTSITFEAGSNLTTIEISAFSGNTSLTSITIPATVTSIGDNAFEYTALTSISIPASVTTIGSRAFYNVSSLQSVTFEAGSLLSEIGSDAFMNADALTSITIPAGVTSIGDSAFFATFALTSINVSADNAVYKSIDGVLFSKNGATLMIYPGGKAGSSYTVPNGVTTIANHAFYGATSLTSITIPEGVTTINDNAFRLTSLTSITLPASVSSLTNEALDNIFGLASINVNADNSVYKSVDGVLFNYDETTLLRYPRGKTGSSYIIPNSVTTIAIYGFYLVESLVSITIPETVTAINFVGIYGAASLRSVIFLGAPPTVGDMNFSELATDARAIINPDLTASFPKVDGKWNGLRVLTVAEAEAEDAAPEPSEPSAPSAPSAEELAAATRAAARVAELAQASARSDLAANSSAPLTIAKFANAGISGITAKNLGEVSAEIAALPKERRSEIGEILKIARKFEVVDIVATSTRINASMLQEIGLIKSDNKNRSAITAALAKLPPSERATYAAIESAIATVMKTFQERRDRLAALKARAKR
jgi:hypothetical protein